MGNANDYNQRRSSFSSIAPLFTLHLSNALALPSIAWPRTETSRVSQLWRRRDNSDKIPSAISIAPSQYWEGNDGPWSSFPLQVGTGDVGGLQNVRVLVSTAGTAIYTVGAEGCPAGYTVDCATERGGLFLRNQSLTWTPNSIYETGLDMNLGLDTSGYAGYDVATLGWQGSGGPTVEHSILWNLATSMYWLGIFGLNPRPTNFTTFTDPQTSYMQTLANEKKIPSVSYGYTAGNQYRLDKVYGSLTLGGYDTNRFVPNDVTFDFYPDISRDLTVNVHSITANKGSLSNLLPDGSISIFIDSTVPELWLPESACAAFEKAFGIEFDDDYNRYLITSKQREALLAQDAKITFKIGPKPSGGDTVDITLPYSAFDLQVQWPIVANPNTSYYFPLQKAANDTQYTLGRTFLQEAYLIADYERQNFSVSQCSWDRGKILSQNLVSILSPNANITNSTSGSYGHKKSSHQVLAMGAIVGVSVGVGGLVSILALILFFFRRRKKLEKRRLAELKEKELTLAAQEDLRNRLNPSHRLGGELGGGDLNEMPPDPKVFLMPEMDIPHSKVDPKKVGYSEMQGQEYFGHGKGFANEVAAHRSVYEMPGSEVRVAEVGRKSGMSYQEGGWI